MTRFLGKLSAKTANVRRAASAPTARFRPQLESLEGRVVPSTLTVTNNLDSGKGSLRFEIAQAEKGGGKTIVFAPSLAGKTITLTSGELEITKSLTIQGPGAGQLTISGGLGYNTSRVFEVDANTQVALSGMTISGGDGRHNGSSSPIYNSDGLGGGILNSGTLTLTGCTVSNNQPVPDGWHSLIGGGIYNAGTLTVSTCTLSGNYADYGGGISNSGTATVQQSTLSGNAAFANGSGGVGGGINNAGTLTVSGCTLSYNSAGSWGGGISNSGTATVQQSTLSGNTAFDGAGIYNSISGTLTVDACILSANSVSDYYSNGSYIYGDGGGINNAGKLTVRNSHFSGNYPDNIYGLYTDGGGNTFG